LIYFFQEDLYSCEFYTGPNIALGKDAEQGPGNYDSVQVVGQAVDGDLSTVNDGRACAHTTLGTTTSPAWWQVDLGDTYRITGIKIYNRNRSRM